MDALKAAIIPVDEEEAKKKRWGRMPFPDLVAALEKAMEKNGPGIVLRTDQKPAQTPGNVVIGENYFEILLYLRIGFQRLKRVRGGSVDTNTIQEKIRLTLATSIRIRALLAATTNLFRFRRVGLQSPEVPTTGLNSVWTRSGYVVATPSRGAARIDAKGRSIEHSFT